MKKFFFLPCIAVFMQLAAVSQAKYIYYFDENLTLVKKSHGFFKGFGTFENGLLELQIYDKRKKDLLILEHFTDSSLAVPNGLFVAYSNNKSKKIEGSFSQGRKVGLWRVWNEKGNVIDSSFFDNGNVSMETTFDYYIDGKLMSVKIDSVETGRVKEIFFDQSGKSVDPYSSENEISKNNVFKDVQVEANFPGGQSAWAFYLSGKVQNHLKELDLKEDFATCLVRFVINKDSTVSEAEEITMKGTRFAKIARDAILEGPKWIPAKQNGVDVDSYKILPVTILKIKEINLPSPTKRSFY